MKNQYENSTSVIKELRKVDSLKSLSEKELVEIAKSLEVFSSIIYEIYQTKSAKNERENKYPGFIQQ